MWRDPLKPSGGIYDCLMLSATLKSSETRWRVSWPFLQTISPPCWLFTWAYVFHICWLRQETDTSEKSFIKPWHLLDERFQTKVVEFLSATMVSPWCIRHHPIRFRNTIVNNMKTGRCEENGTRYMEKINQTWNVLVCFDHYLNF